MSGKSDHLAKISDAARTAWASLVFFSAWAYETAAPVVGAAIAIAIREIDRAANAVAKSAKDGYIADAYEFSKSSAKSAVVWASHKAFEPTLRKKGFELVGAYVFTADGRSVEAASAVKNLVDDEAFDGRWEGYVAPFVPAGTPPEEWRLEARYTYDGRKYGAVVRGGAPSFPRISEPSRRSLPRVSSAALIFGKNKKVDITARVLKYMGPRGDWHGAPDGVNIVDMFPNDDVDDLTYKDCTVVVTDHCMRSETTKFEDGARIKIP